ncbi:hypothetical protein [Acidithiobacillus ferrianus]
MHCSFSAQQLATTSESAFQGRFRLRRRQQSLRKALLHWPDMTDPDYDDKMISLFLDHNEIEECSHKRLLLADITHPQSVWEGLFSLSPTIRRATASPGCPL